MKVTITSEGLSREFSTFDVMRILEIPRERLREWLKLEFIQLELGYAPKGEKQIFLIRDIYKFELFKTLISSGLKRKKASEITSEADKGRYFSELTLIKLGENTKIGIFMANIARNVEDKISEIY